MEIAVIPAFSIKRFRTELENVQERIEREGEVGVELPTFWPKAVSLGTVPGTDTSA